MKKHFVHMQKHRFKTHLKLVILLFGVSMSYLSCQKDDDLSKDTTNSQLEFKRDLITKSQISNNKKVNSIIQTLPKTNTLLTNNFNTQARTVYNEEYDFYINDEKAYHITYGNYDSYTFAIHRSQDNGLIENLILSKQLDGSYKSSIVSYNLNETEKQSIKNGTIPIDIENKMSIQPLSTNAGNRYLSTSTPSIYYDTVTDGCFTPKMNWSDAGELTSIAMTPIGCPEGFIRSIGTGADEGTNAGGVGDDGLFNPNDNPLGNPNTDPSEGGSNTDPYGSPSTGGAGGNGTPNTTGNSNNTGSDNSSGSGQEGSQDCIEVGADGGCIGDVTYPLIPDDEFDEDDFQIINELTDKALCVYNKLKSSSTGFKNSIKKFDGDFTIADIKFVLDDSGNTVKVEDEFGNIIGYDRAYTSFPDPNNLITVSLNNVQNSNNNVNTQPNLLLAQTIAHEVIHAEMFRQILNATENGSIIGLSIQDVLEALASSEYTELYEYFRQHQNWSHTYMAEHFRDVIARMTQEFDTGVSVPDNQQPEQLYLDLAWRGLMNNVAWYNEGQNQTVIENTIDNYLTNNSNETCVD